MVLWRIHAKLLLLGGTEDAALVQPSRHEILCAANEAVLRDKIVSSRPLSFRGCGPLRDVVRTRSGWLCRTMTRGRATPVWLRFDHHVIFAQVAMRPLPSTSLLSKRHVLYAFDPACWAWEHSRTRCLQVKPSRLIVDVAPSPFLCDSAAVLTDCEVLLNPFSDGPLGSPLASEAFRLPNTHGPARACTFACHPSWVVVGMDKAFFYVDARRKTSPVVLAGEFPELSNLVGMERCAKPGHALITIHEKEVCLWDMRQLASPLEVRFHGLKSPPKGYDFNGQVFALWSTLLGDVTAFSLDPKHAQLPEFWDRFPVNDLVPFQCPFAESIRLKKKHEKHLAREAAFLRSLEIISEDSDSSSDDGLASTAKKSSKKDIMLRMGPARKRMMLKEKKRASRGSDVSSTADSDSSSSSSESSSSSSDSSSSSRSTTSSSKSSSNDVRNDSKSRGGGFGTTAENLQRRARNGSANSGRQRAFSAGESAESHGIASVGADEQYANKEPLTFPRFVNQSFTQNKCFRQLYTHYAERVVLLPEHSSPASGYLVDDRTLCLHDSAMRGMMFCIHPAVPRDKADIAL